MPLPGTLKYGTVKWRAVSAVADMLDDADVFPNSVPVTGTVTFTPSVSTLLSLSATEAITVMVRPVTYSMGPDGVLRDAQGNDGVSLLATTSPNVTPVNWTWNVSYQLADGVSSGSFAFRLAADEVVDLTRQTPVASSPGVQLIQGPAGPFVAHKVTHSIGGNDVLLPSDIGAASVSSVQVVSNKTQELSSALGESSYLRGVNLSGPEFTHTPAGLPGVANTDYFYPSAQDFTYLASRGHKLARLPVRWERIQPVRNGPLAAAELGRILTTLSNANAAGMVVNVEIHNYARFINSTANGGATLTLNDGVLTNANLIDLWTRLSTELKGKPGLWAYGLMNEPHSIPETPGIWTPTKTLFGFEVDTNQWAGDSATVARSTAVFHDGVSGLAVTANALTVAYSRNFTANDGGNNTFVAADGPTLSAWVLVPAGTTGSNWQAKFLLQDMAYSNKAGPSINLTPGVWAQVLYSPGTALLDAHRQLSVQFSVDNPATTTAVVHVDTVQQGSIVGAISSSKIWETASQQVLTAIRATGDNTRILVPGYSYSSASRWVENHAAGWITDPANNFAYEAHYYFDRDNSGVYGNTYAAEVTDASSKGYASLAARVTSEISNFTNWCKTNSAAGFLGEFGWPNTGDTAAWNAVGNALYSVLNAKSISGTIWAAGAAYGTGYILSVYTGAPLSVPTSIATAVEANLSTDTAVTPISSRELLVPRTGAVAGQVPVLQAGGTLAFDFPATVAMRPGRLHYNASFGGINNNAYTVTANRLLLIPLLVTALTKFTGIAVNCSTPTTGDVLRLGVYGSGSAGLPAGLIVGSGSTVVPTGDLEVGINVTLPPGLVFVCLTISSGSTTKLRAVGSGPIPNFMNGGGFPFLQINAYRYYYVESMPPSSALPSSLSAATFSDGNAINSGDFPLLALRAAP